MKSRSEDKTYTIFSLTKEEDGCQLWGLKNYYPAQVGCKRVLGCCAKGRSVSEEGSPGSSAGLSSYKMSLVWEMTASVVWDTARHMCAAPFLTRSLGYSVTGNSNHHSRRPGKVCLLHLNRWQIDQYRLHTTVNKGQLHETIYYNHVINDLAKIRTRKILFFLKKYLCISLHIQISSLH